MNKRLRAMIDETREGFSNDLKGWKVIVVRSVARSREYLEDARKEYNNRGLTLSAWEEEARILGISELCKPGAIVPPISITNPLDRFTFSEEREWRDDEKIIERSKYHPHRVFSLRKKEVPPVIPSMVYDRDLNEIGRVYRIEEGIIKTEDYGGYGDYSATIEMYDPLLKLVEETTVKTLGFKLVYNGNVGYRVLVAYRTRNTKKGSSNPADWGSNKKT